MVCSVMCICNIIILLFIYHFFVLLDVKKKIKKTVFPLHV